jgi:hypothetical protein
MKPEKRQPTNIAKRIFAAAVVLLGISILSGCITTKVLELGHAREKRIKEASNFWSLAAVRSGYVDSSGDVFACVEFRDSPGEAPQAFTINLSQASRLGRSFADFMPVSHGQTEAAHQPEASAEVAWRLYPLQEAQRGCDNPIAENPSSVSAPKIDAIQIRREDQSRLTQMRLSREGGATNESQLIEFSDHETESSGASNVLLAYLPPTNGAEQAQAIGVAGAFEPGSEWVNPYTLLIAPAIAADTAVSYMIIMLGGRVWEYWGYR